MILEKADCIPFTMVEKVLEVVASVLLFMIVVVAIDPPRLEVMVFPVLLRVLEVLRLVIARLVPVAFVKSRLEMVEVRKLAIEEKRLVEVALLVLRLVIKALVVVEFPKIGF
jgi:hypothetical protein